jgi:hypothetical protein
MGSDQGYACKVEGRAHFLVMERERDEVKLRMRLQKEQALRTSWRSKGSAIGQIMDTPAKGAGTTHQLKVERERNGFRLRMRLQKE